MRHVWNGKTWVPAPTLKPVLPCAVGSAGWPIRMDALAVLPKQVAEANERNRRHGVKARYDRDGTPVVHDAADRRRLIRLDGFVDRDSFI